MTSVAVLVTAGRHPHSGRPRRERADAAALELALRLPGASVALVHAGDPAEPALHDYLGMGVAALDAIELADGADAVPALAHWLRQTGPDLILTGDVRGDGEGSGLVPYHLAHALDRPLLPGACDLAVEDGRVTMLQALPKGRRRRLRAALPALVTVSTAAPAPRQVAFAQARRGRIHRHADTIDRPPYRPDWTAAPTRPRPKRIKTIDPDARPEDRLRAITESAAGGGEILTQLSAEQAADTLLDRLTSLGLIPSRAGDPDRHD